MVFVERFEWLVRIDGAERWVRLMGADGWALLGTGLMHLFAKPAPIGTAESVADRLLRQAHLIAHDLRLRAAVMREPATDGIERAETLPGAAVLACRALGFADPEQGRLRSHERPPLEVLCVATG